eukprot:903575-Amphidinium_carterae.1
MMTTTLRNIGTHVETRGRFNLARAQPQTSLAKQWFFSCDHLLCLILVNFADCGDEALCVVPGQIMCTARLSGPTAC